jgi:hypothetical protein
MSLPTWLVGDESPPYARPGHAATLIDQDLVKKNAESFRCDRPDKSTHETPVFAKDEGIRQSDDLEIYRHLTFRVLPIGIVNMRLTEKCLRRSHIVVFEIHADEHNISVAVIPPCLLQSRSFLAAWYTPRGPEVHHHGLALEIL